MRWNIKVADEAEKCTAQEFLSEAASQTISYFSFAIKFNLNYFFAVVKKFGQCLGET